MNLLFQQSSAQFTWLQPALQRSVLHSTSEMNLQRKHIHCYTPLLPKKPPVSLQFCSFYRLHSRVCSVWAFPILAPACHSDAISHHTMLPCLGELHLSELVMLTYASFITYAVPAA